jgi:hypothetical protein
MGCVAMTCNSVCCPCQPDLPELTPSPVPPLPPGDLDVLSAVVVLAVLGIQISESNGGPAFDFVVPTILDRIPHYWGFLAVDLTGDELPEVLVVSRPRDAQMQEYAPRCACC